MAFLEKDVFSTVISSTPLVSIDLLIENSKGQVLLGYRNNRPAKGYWFVPGGRILKDETMDDAFKRLTLAELGEVFTRDSAQFLGPYEHFYDDYVFGEGESTHYVVLGYKVVSDIDISRLPSAQHNQYKWFDKAELLADDTVHKHSKWYVE
jgi:colanic acid biosynthesis protein WcaH